MKKCDSFSHQASHFPSLLIAFPNMHAHSLQWVMLLVSLTLVCSFQIRSFSYKSSFSASVPTNNRNPTGTDLSMLPDGFSLPLADLFPADTSTLSTGSFLVQNTQADDIQNAAIITAAISYFIYEKRPRGSANAELFEVKRSSIPGANLGLFCKSVIPKGTVLGTYPGVLGKVTKALERSKCMHVFFVRVFKLHICPI